MKCYLYLPVSNTIYMSEDGHVHVVQQYHGVHCMSHVEQDLLAIPEHLNSPRCFSQWGLTCSIFSFLCNIFNLYIIVCHFIRFRLVTVLFVLRFTTSDLRLTIFGIWNFSQETSHGHTIVSIKYMKILSLKVDTISKCIPKYARKTYSPVN